MPCGTLTAPLESHPFQEPPSKRHKLLEPTQMEQRNNFMHEIDMILGGPNPEHCEAFCVRRLNPNPDKTLEQIAKELNGVYWRIGAWEYSPIYRQEAAVDGSGRVDDCFYVVWVDEWSTWVWTTVLDMNTITKYGDGCLWACGDGERTSFPCNVYKAGRDLKSRCGDRPAHPTLPPHPTPVPTPVPHPCTHMPPCIRWAVQLQGRRNRGEAWRGDGPHPGGGSRGAQDHCNIDFGGAS